MTDKIVLITDPDDIEFDGFRVLLAGLTQPQSDIVSNALTNLSSSLPMIVVYMWTQRDSVEWLLDKKHKSNLIIFNADMTNEILVGYMAAQPSSYYFGVLKTLQVVNNRVLYNSDDCIDIINTNAGVYEEKYK